MKKIRIKKKKKTASSSNEKTGELARILNKAIQLHQAGNLSEAKAIYHRILANDSNNLDSVHLLGLIEYQSGNIEEAISLLSRAMTLNPHHPDIHNNLGLALMSRRKLPEAISCFKEAIRLNPDFIKAYYNLGNVFKDQKNFSDAVEYYNRALSISPDFPEVRNNLGNIFKEEGRLDEALEQYRTAISLRPDFSEAYNNMGAVLDDQGNLSDAIQFYSKAIETNPGYFDAYLNLGNLLYLKEGKLDKAISLYNEAIRVDPGSIEAHFHRGLALLLNGNFKEGWPDYLWRFGKNIENSSSSNNFNKPLWDGSSLAGKRIVISSEQGSGDCIQFVRYLPLLKKLGAYVIFECYGNLLNLFKGLDSIDLLIEGPFPNNTHIEYDYFVPLLCLPVMFHTDIDTIIDNTPYIHTNPDSENEWSKKINKDSFSVGLVWQGSPTHKNDYNRSCDLSDFIPLTSISGISFYSLQKEITGYQKDQLEQMNILSLGDGLDDFDDTAAAMKNLDLIISVDTAAVHLAGAIGKPVWTLLPFVPDWRWMLKRDDSPWYRTMRLFRQSHPGDWINVILQVRGELEKTASQPALK